MRHVVPFPATISKCPASCSVRVWTIFRPRLFANLMSKPAGAFLATALLVRDLNSSVSRHGEETLNRDGPSGAVSAPGLSRADTRSASWHEGKPLEDRGDRHRHRRSRLQPRLRRPAGGSEKQQELLGARLGEAPTSTVRLYPRLAEVYAEKVGWDRFPNASILDPWKFPERNRALDGPVEPAGFLSRYGVGL
jgi:hypothetical protein